MVCDGEDGILHGLRGGAIVKITKKSQGTTDARGYTIRCRYGTIVCIGASDEESRDQKALDDLALQLDQLFAAFMGIK